MIIYDLECGAKHHFEGWFKNAEEFVEQQQTGMLICPLCGSEQVRKIPSASHIVKGGAENVTRTQDTEIVEASKRQVLQLFHDYIDNNFDDVGNKFAEEAIKIHHGESNERNIRGTATADEVKELKQEGISAVQLPPAPYDKDKLN
ncbi:MAG: DUF1178 family protein [Gammaproteobacteria bacterium]|nr:DUF1178 family protein [Gammaproteobacteria bacterium]